MNQLSQRIIKEVRHLRTLASSDVGFRNLVDAAAWRIHFKMEGSTAPWPMCSSCGNVVLADFCAECDFSRMGRMKSRPSAAQRGLVLAPTKGSTATSTVGGVGDYEEGRRH